VNMHSAHQNRLYTLLKLSQIVMVIKKIKPNEYPRRASLSCFGETNQELRVGNLCKKLFTKTRIRNTRKNSSPGYKSIINKGGTVYFVKPVVFYSKKAYLQE